MSYNQIRKFDESLERMQETSASCDKCFCHLIATPEDERRNLGTSFKQAFTSYNPGKKRRNVGGRRGVDIPLVFAKGEQGVYSTKEVVKRKSSYGGCGCCDREKLIQKHSYANIHLTTPELAPLCPCPTDGFAEKPKPLNNIKVTIEKVTLDPDSENSETSLLNHRLQRNVREPKMSEKKSVTSLIDAQYERDEDNLFDR
ncbi:uncharacterized protein LOC111351426 [Spodoptera litura]|uniref:Uncharacterized protein LOC111351426 n=1 Tax=Spodoptera litura TaxID=69820 RepID=A0A9J7ILF4_SPOLT|nr:uncharacterized protein LOC111351426 [Spodoptera litura]